MNCSDSKTEAGGFQL